MDKVMRIPLGSAGKEKVSDVELDTLIMGIDLGTTNSAVAIYTMAEVPSLVAMSVTGRTTMPSCVKWDASEKDGCEAWTIGEEAYKERYMSDVCYSVKRIMGSGEKVRFIDRRDTNHCLDMTPAEVSSLILGELKRRVNDSYPGLRRCIITVPAYFSQRQIEDTIEASKLADLECVQILKEPTAASYIYSQLGYVNAGAVLIYDLGGGTFDATHMTFIRKSDISMRQVSALKRMYGIDINALDSEGSSLYFCQVLGTYGDTHLGGDDIDIATAKLVVKNTPGANLSPQGFEELVLRCEQFKKQRIEGSENIIEGVTYKVTQEDLRAATREIFARTLSMLNNIPEDAFEDIQTIVLVGGSTKNDYLVQLLSEAFPGKEISRVLDPDATVALGAGAVAKDVANGKGAAYQDVLPMAIGVLDKEKEINICIPKNTPLPYSMSRKFFTMYDNQEAVSVDVYQGVSRNPDECIYLGKLRISELPPAPAGKIEVIVNFILNSQGRLKVTTTVQGLDKPCELIIENIYSVSENKPTDETVLFFNYDEFEKNIAELCLGNESLTRMVMARREALIAGDTAKAEDIELNIVGAL